MKHKWVVLLALLWRPAQEAQAQDSMFTDALLASYVVAGFTDTAQTAYCLGARTCREANPVMRWAIDQSSVPVAMTAKGALHVGITYVLHKYHKDHPRTVRWVAVVLTAAQLAVVVLNTKATQAAAD